jgi:septum formation protein
VVSAVALLTQAGPEERVSVTRVLMRPLPDRVIEWYLGTGEWRERAGGYAIQGAGAALIERIDGEHSGVVGLPLACLADALDAAGLAPWSAARGPQYRGG